MKLIKAEIVEVREGFCLEVTVRRLYKTLAEAAAALASGELAEPEPKGSSSPMWANGNAGPTLTIAKNEAPPAPEPEKDPVVAATQAAAAETFGTDQPYGEPKLPAAGDVYDGRQVTEVRVGTDGQFVFARLADGTKVKFDASTGAEVGRIEAKPAEPPKRQGIDPDDTRRAYARQAGVPDEIYNCGTLREVVVLVHGMFGPERTVSWLQEHADNVPATHGIDAAQLAGRVERIMMVLPGATAPAAE